MQTAPICGIHRTEMKWKPPGISKAGKNYQGFWTCGTKNPDNTWCTYKPPQATEGREGANQRFQDGMAATGQMMSQTKKDETITRIAISKSLIERGEKWSPAAKAEAEAWLAWVENRTPKAMPTDEIQIEDIPF
jgi:hypothetical protein